MIKFFLHLVRNTIVSALAGGIFLPLALVATASLSTAIADAVTGTSSTSPESLMGAAIIGGTIGGALGLIYSIVPKRGKEAIANFAGACIQAIFH